jgi:hypothetical protein
LIDPSAAQGLPLSLRRVQFAFAVGVVSLSVGRFPGGVEPAPPPVGLEPAGTVTPAVGFDPVLEGLVGTTPPAVVGLSEVGLVG